MCFETAFSCCTTDCFCFCFFLNNLNRKKTHSKVQNKVLLQSLLSCFVETYNQRKTRATEQNFVLKVL